MLAARACRRWDPCSRRRRSWAWRLPRGLEHASHVLGHALWHAFARTGASPRAPQLCSTSREDKRAGFTVPPQTTRDLLGHRERERLGEGTSRARRERGERAGGDLRSKRKRCIQSQRAGLPQVMMMIIEVFFFFRSKWSSAPYTLRKVRIWEIPGKRLIRSHRHCYEKTVLLPRTPFPIPALRSPPSPSLLSILEPCLVSTICDRLRPPLLKLCCLSMT